MWAIRAGGFAALLVLVACNDPGAGMGGAELSGTETVLGSPLGDGGAAQVVHRFGYDAFDPSSEAGAGGAGDAQSSAEGDGGAGFPPDDAVSTRCQDGILGDDEECDDGDDGSDACTASCQTRDQPIVPLPSDGSGRERSHYLGLGRHPLAGGDNGFLAAFTDLTGDAPAVSASLYNRYGQQQQTGFLSLDASPIVDANPVVAALPGGAYAIAWTDFDGDGSDLGIALRRLSANAELGPLGFANSGRDFSQRDADLIWDGSELVAAWVDFADAFSGPDLRYRTFDAQLRPTSDDLTLAGTDAPESAVALAAVQGGFAAAYREGSDDGHEYVVVKSGAQITRVGPLLGGPISDRPALVELDATHVLVVFSEAVEPADGPADFTRLSYAVVDRTETATIASRALSPLDELWNRSDPASQVSPSAERAADGVYVAWRSEARPGDAAGDQLWLKLVRWDAGSASLNVGETELLLPRTCEESVGDQRLPALTATQLPPHGGLAVAWEDYGLTQGQHSSQPEVVVHFAPNHLMSADTFSEAWDGVDGGAWDGHWTSELSGPFAVTTQRGAGQISNSGTGTLALEAVNDRSAANVELLSDVRLSPASRAGLFTRRADSDPSTYLAFQFGSLRDEPWRTYLMSNGVQTDIQVIPPPNNVPVRASEWAYRVRFRTATQADGSLFVGARVWSVGEAEPSAWTLGTTLPADSLAAQIASAPGRFGLLAQPKANRETTFDDFQARFFDGALLGDLDAVPQSVPLPLLRREAEYRRCTPEAPCVEAGGCCDSSADCAAGAACSSKLSLNQPLGSHADACVVDHCANQTRDADEQGPDCGGADCAPCACQVSASNGTPGYCPTTCPCGAGDSSCTQDSQCVAGLSCTTASAPKYGWAAGSGACTPFHCANAELDFGETFPDCGGECGSCSVVDVTGAGGVIDAASGALQRVSSQAPLRLSSVSHLAEGQTLCLLTDASQVTLDALAFNRIHDYSLVPGVPACFVVDSDLLLQSTNLPDETLNSLNEVAGLDWQLSNETSQFQLNGLDIGRWLASVGGSVHDAAQVSAALQPMYTDGGALMDSSRYLVGSGTASDWTFLQQPGTLFMVLRPDAEITGYLLGTVHDSSASAGSGYGIYFDASVSPPRLRFRVGNGSSSYVYSFNTDRAFPIGSKTVLAATMTTSKLEAFREYDSIGSDDTATGSLSSSPPYSVALVGAKASTSKTPFPGAIFEVDHYAGAMSQRARQAIVQYLQLKHGIEGPPAHCLNQQLDAGEQVTDCGGECGCSGVCASACGLTIGNFPLSGDGHYYNVNLLRRAAALPALPASVTYANGAVQWGGYPLRDATDGTAFDLRWSTPTPNDPDATATLVYDMGGSVALGAIRQRYTLLNTEPGSFHIRVGQGSPVVWTEVLPETVVVDTEMVTEFEAPPARYVEVTFTGTRDALPGATGGIVELMELELFAAASQSPAPNSSQGYDLTDLASALASTNGNLWGSAASAIDNAYTYVQGKSTATGDGLLTLDLGGLFEVSEVQLAFHGGGNWLNGGKIELGVDGAQPGDITWTAVVDTGVGAPLGLYPGVYQMPKQPARYVRLTNYFVSGQGTSTGGLDEISVF